MDSKAVVHETTALASVKVEDEVPDGMHVVTLQEWQSVETKVEQPPPPTISRPYQLENLQCYQCFITFCSSKAKERHMKKSHREEYKAQLQQGDTLFTCYVCESTFLSSIELTQHQSTHTKEEKPFKCASCDQSFKTFSEVTTHRRTVCREKPCLCSDCGYSCKTMALLRAHRLTHKVKDENTGQVHEVEKTHKCAKCGVFFESESDLIEHQENHAGEKRCKSNGAVNLNAVKPGPKKRGRPSKASLLSSQEQPDNDCKKEIKSEDKDDQKKEVKPGKRPKMITGKNTSIAVVSKSKTGRRGRPRKGAVVNPSVYVCKECDKTFASRTKLKTHQRFHKEKKAHPCQECDESFNKPEQLAVHQQRAHGGGRHTCQECGKSFTREANLKAHEKMHSAAGNQTAR
ncbi:zinc finger protein 585B-like [Erpetoichthys calabaricus]|uniref:Zinc finger protein 585B-like n=1 Tax=Erpetoichthys calabaricus TaxID=27687 RepID=A0A8C4TFJ6_ERPCA|nr:zinc finger protein 585B-like [Erpetoichthys calabaricus]XP_028678415.1 zinc finger protein 585B-like [Erpetoichthys calabaricus]XP_028678416.1 zinc finger protein 585B-like [Erpetoichthys calabaricus]XP_028678418.1 zinc finger protein 585B-like [Erpetoichthys calabaricus]